ncbi:MAG: hypothetical protein AB7G11_01315 [Phycisphaerales bacterium]
MATWRINDDGSQFMFETVCPPGSTDCYGVCVTSNEAGDIVYAAGVYEGSQGKDIIVVAYCNQCNINGFPDGKAIWTQPYNNALQGANEDDVPVVIRYTPGEGLGGSGGTEAVYIAGHSIGRDNTSPPGFSTSFDFIVMKLSAIASPAFGGQSLWGFEVPTGYPVVVRYDGPAHSKDTVSDMLFTFGPITPYIVGTSTGSTGGNSTGPDMCLIRIDESVPGVPTMSAARYDRGFYTQVGCSGSEYANCMTIIGNTIYITGSSNCKLAPVPPYPPTLGDDDFCTIAFSRFFTHSNDPQVPLYVAPAFDGDGHKADAGRIIVTGGGEDGQVGLYVSGDAWNGATTGYDIVTIRYNIDFDPLLPTWTRTFDNPNHHAEDRVADMLVDRYGNAYITGKSYNGASEVVDYVTYSLQWQSGADRWWANSNPLVHEEYYSGDGHGQDFGVAMRFIYPPPAVNDTLSDVCVLGQATETNESGAKAQRYTVVRYDQFIPPP